MIHLDLVTFLISLTGRKESALLVADSTTVKMLLLWTKVLNRMSFSASTLAFPDFEGNVMKHPERKMITAASLLGHTLPLPTAFRKELETRNKRQEGPLREAVSRALAHSLSTAQQYYQAPTISDAYMAYRAMQDIITGTRGLSPPAGVLQKKEVPAQEEEQKEREEWGAENRGAKGKGKRKRTTTGEEEEGVPQKGKRKRTSGEEEEGVSRKGKRKRTMTGEEEEGVPQKGKRKRTTSDEEEKGLLQKQSATSRPTSPRKRKGFTPRQENVIATYFAQHIEKRDFPTSVECRDFIKVYPEFASRKPKDIYDKCRNLAGR